MVKLPKINKKISSFLYKEDGKITKENLIKTGLALGAAAVASVQAASAHSSSYNPDCDGITAPDEGSAHSNSLTLAKDTNKLTSTHSSCIENHSSHSHSTCCFPENTAIATAAGSRPIQEIKVSDRVISYDIKKKEEKESVVLKLESPVREGYYKISAGKSALKITNEHPIYTKKKDGKICWAAVDEMAAMKESPESGVISKLEPGDSIFNRKLNWLEVKKIDYVRGSIQTYNLKKIKDFNTFFADDFLVHNKGGPCSW